MTDSEFETLWIGNLVRRDPDDYFTVTAISQDHVSLSGAHGAEKESLRYQGLDEVLQFKAIFERY